MTSCVLLAAAFAGVAANLVCVFVLYSKRIFDRPFRIFLIALLVADTSYLATTVIKTVVIDLTHSVVDPASTNAFAFAINLLTNASLTTTAYMTLAVTIHLLRVKKNSIKKTLKYDLTSLLMSMLSSVMFFLPYKIYYLVGTVNGTKGGETFTSFTHSNVFREQPRLSGNHVWVTLILLRSVPPVATIIAGIMIYFRARTTRERNPILAISAMFVVCHAASAILAFATASKGDPAAQLTSYQAMLDLADLFTVVNSSAKFAICAFTDGEFGQRVKALFRCRRRSTMTGCGSEESVQ